MIDQGNQLKQVSQCKKSSKSALKVKYWYSWNLYTSCYVHTRFIVFFWYLNIWGSTHWFKRDSWKYTYTRSLGARWAMTSSCRPFGPALGPSGLLDFVLRALQVLRPCDSRNDASDSDKSKSFNPEKLHLTQYTRRLYTIQISWWTNGRTNKAILGVGWQNSNYRHYWNMFFNSLHSRERMKKVKQEHWSLSNERHYREKTELYHAVLQTAGKPGLPVYLVLQT